VAGFSRPVMVRLKVDATWNRNQYLRGANVMSASTRSVGRFVKVGVITDMTGPLSFAGIANANVARMVIDDI
jgi:hypothetical protein